MNNIYLHLLNIRQEDYPLVLATVTKSVGSTPQKPGSSAIFNREGLLTGTVGGGVLEGEVQKIALNAVQSKVSGLYNFKLDTEVHNGIGAICGGQASILVDASPLDSSVVFEQIRKSIKNRVPGVLVTSLSDMPGKKFRIKRYWVTKPEKETEAKNLDEKIGLAVSRLLADKYHPGFEELDVTLSGEENKTKFLFEPIFPPPHLVIAGAGHIGKALSHIGKLLEFEVTVIDERSEYANPVNLPDADHIIVKDVGEAMDELQIASDTYIVIVTRGHKDDAKALRPCIGSDAAYIGMIGSKNKVSLMRTEFLQKGWAEPPEWKKIHAPIGLDIQSISVQEIAISITAQIILVKNAKIPANV
jgi:xanthine dehydrogenase accessory factor